MASVCIFTISGSLSEISNSTGIFCIVACRFHDPVQTLSLFGQYFILSTRFGFQLGENGIGLTFCSFTNFFRFGLCFNNGFLFLYFCTYYDGGVLRSAVTFGTCIFCFFLR